MASGAQQQHHQHSQPPQALPTSSSQQHNLLMQQQSSNHQMQSAPQQQEHPIGLRTACFDPQQQQVHQHSVMSPIMTSMPINHSQTHGLPMNSQQQQSQIMRPVVGSPIMNQAPCNQQPSEHIQSQHQQQKSQILPLLLSPRPPSQIKSGSADQSKPTNQSEDDHDPIIDQVLSLENDYSDTTGMLSGVDDGAGVMLGHQQQQTRQQQHQESRHSHQQQQHLMGDNNIGSGIGMADSGNQFSSSSEDLLNLLLEFDRDSSNFIGLETDQQDEKVGIETIRKQLMSCEVQSDQNQPNTNSMPTMVSQQMTCQPQQPNVALQQQQQHSSNTNTASNNNVHQQQLVSQPSPVITHHQQSHQIPTSGSSQISTDQAMLHGPYSNVPMSPVPVSSSGQPFANQQHQQHVARVSQSNPMSIVSNSPSPSWQQPQLSPYSPQNQHINPRTPTQSHPVHSMQQNQPTTSIQMQQLHNPLLQTTRSPSQSVSPPATTEPSPVVKKNPLLNAQLINTRAPSITPTRFRNNQTSVLNQNPILNAKLSQSPFVTNNCGTVGSPVNTSLNSQSRFIQQTQHTTNFNFDLTQQQNAQQHIPQQSGHIGHYGHTDQTDQQQSAGQLYRTATTTPTSSGAIDIGAPGSIGSTSPSGVLSQQVKQEIRRKVQQPKQQHQTTSLLKQLLSDDNK